MPTDNEKVNGTLYIYGKNGKLMELGEVISCDIDRDAEETEGFVYDLSNIGSDKEFVIEFNNCFINRKHFNKFFYKISNNYLRLHGGHALRERQRYKAWRKRHGIKI